VNLRTAAKWISENELSGNREVCEAVMTATSQAFDYGKAYAISLWAGDDMISRLVRDAIKANGDLPWHGSLAS
jgi:hypothetical protein